MYPIREMLTNVHPKRGPEEKRKRKKKKQASSGVHQRRANPRLTSPTVAMKVLTLNFMTCAVKACKGTAASYPLHPKDVELVQDEIEMNPDMLLNLLPRLDWAALKTTSTEVSFALFFFPFCLPWTSGLELFCWSWDFPLIPLRSLLCLHATNEPPSNMKHVAGLPASTRKSTKRRGAHG